MIGDKRAQRYTWCLCVFICTVPFAWISFLGKEKYYTNNKDLLYSIGSSTQYSTMIIWKKKKKTPDTCICMTEPPHSTSETNTINLQTNYTSIQNKNQIKVNHYIFSTLPGQGSLSHAPVPQIGVIFPFYSSVYFLTSSINVYSMKRWKRVVCRQIQNIISVVFSFFYPQAHSLVLSQEKHQINPNWGTFFRKSEQDVS